MLLTITDQEGRRLKVTQGAGDGTMFGTDEANNGGLLHVKQCVTTLALNGMAIISTVTNSGGGKVSLSGFSAAK